MPRKSAETVFAVTTVLSLAAVAVAAALLPDRVPTHFGASGAADDWSTRAGAVTFLALFTAGVAAMFAGLVRWTGRLPLAWINVPEKQRWVDAGREPELRRRLREDLLLFGAGVNLLALAVTAAVVQAARSDSGGLPGWWFVVFGAWLLVTITHAVLVGAVRYRLDPADGGPGR